MKEKLSGDIGSIPGWRVEMDKDALKRRGESQHINTRPVKKTENSPGLKELFAKIFKR